MVSKRVRSRLVFTPKGLYSTARGQRATARATPGTFAHPQSAYVTRGGAALTPGCRIQPLRRKAHLTTWHRQAVPLTLSTRPLFSRRLTNEDKSMQSFVFALLLLFSQPGLSQGIVPGMSFIEIERRLGEKPLFEYAWGGFGRYSSSTYRQSKLWIYYEGGTAKQIDRLSPPRDIPPPSLPLPPLPTP
jgi:hypothetical protein